MIFLDTSGVSGNGPKDGLLDGWFVKLKVTKTMIIVKV